MESDCVYFLNLFYIYSYFISVTNSLLQTDDPLEFCVAVYRLPHCFAPCLVFELPSSVY